MSSTHKVPSQAVETLAELRHCAAELETLQAQIQQLKEALRESEQQFITTIDSLSDAIYVVDPDLRVVRYNKALRQWNENLGLETNFIGRTLSEIYPFLPEKVERECNRVFRTGKSHIEERSIAIGERNIICEIRKIPIFKKGKVTLVVAVIRDITDLKRAEEALARMTLQQKQLIKTARHLTESPDIKKVLTKIGAGAKEIAKAQACAIYLLAEDGKILTPVVTNDLQYTKQILATPLKVDGSFTGQAVKARRGLIFNDACSNPAGYQIPGTPVEEEERVLAVPFVVDEKVLGAICLNRMGSLFTEEDLALAETFATYAATALKSAQTHHQLQREVGERQRAEEELKRSFEKLQRLLEETVHVLLSAVEIRDPYTASHQRRTTVLACAIAEQMQLPKDQIDGLRLAALIHDVGKIYVPAEILNRPGNLTNTERSLIQMHPQAGHDVLKLIEFPWPVAQIVIQHHERLDGSGFPHGLSGDDILLEAKILGVADVIEAMCSHRPYRPAHALNEALEEIKQNRGVLYDPEVVDACLKLFAEEKFAFDPFER